MYVVDGNMDVDYTDKFLHDSWDAINVFWAYSAS